MKKFRKKPVVIEAMQWDGTMPCWERLVEFVGSDLELITIDPPCVRIPTPEGVMTASRGDWIIKGVRGEFYPCKDSVLRETYEPLEDTDDSVEA